MSYPPSLMIGCPLIMEKDLAWQGLKCLTLLVAGGVFSSTPQVFLEYLRNGWS